MGGVREWARETAGRVPPASRHVPTIAWKMWSSPRDWERVATVWARYMHAAQARTDVVRVSPRDEPSVPHVYVYALPLLGDGSTVLQLRDQSLYHVGLFGGEVEAWRPEVCKHLCEMEGAPHPMLPRSVWQQAQAELQQELGVGALTCDDVVVMERTSPFTHWCSIVVLVLGRVPACPDFRTVLTSCLPRARDLGYETLSVIPVTPMVSSVSTLQAVFKFQRHHDAHLAQLLRMHSDGVGCGGGSAASAASATKTREEE